LPFIKPWVVILKGLAMTDNAEMRKREQGVLAFFFDRRLSRVDRRIGRLIYEIIALITTPFVVIITGLWATVEITDKLAAGLDNIATKQDESAQLIATTQKEQLSRIVNADIDRERIEHLIKSEDEIIEKSSKLFANNKDISDKNVDKIKSDIAEFEIYEDLALPFLSYLKKYYEDKMEERENTQSDIYLKYKELHERVRVSIQHILQKSQADFSHIAFKGKGEFEKINLRNRSFKNIDLKNSVFSFTNLYRSDFENASLNDTKFSYSDLVNVNFKGANLRGSEFEYSDLYGAIFDRAYLKDVEFKDCKNLNKAQFSFIALLNATEKPFYSIPTDVYESLLKPYETKIRNLKNEKNRLNKVFERLRITEPKIQDKFETLLKKLEDIEQTSEHHEKTNHIGMDTN
jgi:hypothetical protein